MCVCNGMLYYSFAYCVLGGWGGDGISQGGCTFERSMISILSLFDESYCMLGAGEGVEAVASAKAGIIKEGRPVVIAKQTYPDAERVLRERGWY